jgi:hypothetical protein
MARTSNSGGESKTPKAPAKTPARRRTGKAKPAAAAAANDSLVTNAPAGISQRKTGGTLNLAEVQRRAYELFVQRGCSDGHDKEDWYEAERQLGQRR